MFRATISGLKAGGMRQFIIASRTTIQNTISTRSAILRKLPQRPITTSTSTPINSLRSKSRSQTTNFTFSSNPRPSSETLIQRLRTRTNRYFHNSRTRRNGEAKPENLGDDTSLSGRMKKLSREYGWSVVGVYIFLSAADFPFCYLLVRTLGTDRIGEWEHTITSSIKSIIPESIKTTFHEWRVAMQKASHDVTGSDKLGDGVEMAGWGVEEAEERNKRDASLGTQLALAYAIHKSFIFIRVPLTAAVTPKVVRTLRGWGWDIGKRTTKEAKKIAAVKHAAQPAKPLRTKVKKVFQTRKK
ncbi:putative peptide alpha-n-acetyltransferase protein [Botrytis fragariae]|uniref:Putative peptide alpha-n-acetyltransferase protein n=1 Tax=Botrytis fragariae TaxID=1964551 RepID=A0A8H6AWN1_9HELO|nr:putative peptide alpha-n-acetyltransferase protein [Botrytis fragariae]KAF5874864.1 putative peptide alpha-n-acetyltransferase protein [Botrytis fragariae]